MFKKEDYFLADDGSFFIKDYNNKPAFSSFLPAIAGEWGVPFWVFYVNRAQGVFGFGLGDKDHAFGEFFPANQAYSLVSYLGFRTFIMIDGKPCYEVFSPLTNHHRQEVMIIRSASLEIKKINYNLGLDFSLKYFTLANSPLGGLVRVLRIKNINKKPCRLQILDGMTKVIPFGCGHFFLKNLSRTIEAWMQSYKKNNLCLFRLLVHPQDTSFTQYIEGANFVYAFYEDNGKLFHPDYLINPSSVFGEDTFYLHPVISSDNKFPTENISFLKGKTPCCFSHFNWHLNKDEEKVFYSLWGGAFYEDQILSFIKRVHPSFLKEKEKENRRVIDKIKNNIFAVTAYNSLNHYLKNTYLDNVLRGGYPYSTGEGFQSYYIFSRKHGDLERDYNNFFIRPSYFSEGEANYRDIAQNRRLDLFFHPQVGRKNIKYFLNFIKIDGYNPLVIRGEKLFFRKNEIKRFITHYKIKTKKIISLLEEGAFLGEILSAICHQLGQEKFNKLRDDLVAYLLKYAQREPSAEHREGYWIDHWHYTLDLFENYLYFFPDKLNELFKEKDYYFWDEPYYVLPRQRRYYLKRGEVYQGQAVERKEDKEKIISRRKHFSCYLHTRVGKPYRTTLGVKLLSLILNKVSSLDPYGVGVEMEASKPGWCDSLNGLPALLGSSLCETLEIKRCCQILKDALSKIELEKLVLPQEIYSFYNKISFLLNRYFSLPENERDFFWWQRSQNIKEEFRKKTFYCLSGEERTIKKGQLINFLNKIISKVDLKTKKSFDKKTNLPLTYFRHNVKKFCKVRNFIYPQRFIQKPLPLFLEGPMHYIKVEKSSASSIYKNLKKSLLFDNKLKMYKLNCPLDKESLEIGRSRIFPKGWLENESIWLHMEYKYLLEVLKSGLVEEFYSDFLNCAVPFFEPQKYGRSILENSSFIVSSSYFDKKIWGRGFVARLSGATVEFLNIWMVLCLGFRPFYLDKDGKLILKFSPLLKGEMFLKEDKEVEFNGERLIFAKNTFAFNLFSSVLVVYYNPKRKDTFRKCKAKKIVVEKKDGEKIPLAGDFLPSPLSYQVRERKIKRIDVYWD